MEVTSNTYFRRRGMRKSVFMFLSFSDMDEEAGWLVDAGFVEKVCEESTKYYGTKAGRGYFFVGPTRVTSLWAQYKQVEWGNKG